MRDYVDLEITIRKDSVSFSIDDVAYEGATGLTDELLAHLTECRMEGPETYGAQLFQAVFQHDPKVREGYLVARSAYRKRERRFRLRLRVAVNEPRLHSLCWEALRDPDPPPQRLAAWSGTPLSRLLANESVEPAHAPRLRVLGVVASPEDLGEQGKWENLAKIDRDAERFVLADAITGLKDRVTFELLEAPATYANIRERLKDGGFHVLHLVCHGAFIEAEPPEGVVMLETEQRTVQPVGDTDMADLVKDLDDLQLVILAACEGAARSHLDAFLGVAPKMIEFGLPAVIAMQDEVEQESTQIFTRAFYDSLARSTETGGLVDVAVNDAREKMFFKHRIERPTTWEWVTPVLFLRGDGKLFEPVDADASTGTELDAVTTQSATPPSEGTVTQLRTSRRFERTPQPAPPEQVGDWRLDTFHLLIDTHKFTLDELRNLAWLVGLPARRAMETRSDEARAVIGAAYEEGKQAALFEKVAVLVSQRAKSATDLLRLAR